MGPRPTIPHSGSGHSCVPVLVQRLRAMESEIDRLRPIALAKRSRCEIHWLDPRDACRLA